MSDIKVVLVHADAREDRTVTTGTKAWELYAEEPVVTVRSSRASAWTRTTLMSDTGMLLGAGM